MLLRNWCDKILIYYSNAGHGQLLFLARHQGDCPEKEIVADAVPLRDTRAT